VTFVSLGMVVLDELRFPGKRPLSDVMGGSASYGIGLQPGPGDRWHRVWMGC
jgi:hypothetical protein